MFAPLGRLRCGPSLLLARGTRVVLILPLLLGLPLSLLVLLTLELFVLLTLLLLLRIGLRFPLALPALRTILPLALRH